MTAQRSSFGVVLVFCLGSLVLLQASWAQPPKTRPDAGGRPPAQDQPRDFRPSPDGAVQPPAEASDWPRLREPRARGAAPRSEEGQRSLSAPAAPSVRIRPDRMPPSRNWFLGVYPERAPRGLRIAQVVRGSPAHRFGLEEGDYILDVSGYVVGEYQGRFYPLAMAMDYGTDPNGWAELLVWNKRTFSEELIWVQLQRRR